MTTIALTGANGFLGWHVRCAAHSAGMAERLIAVGDAYDSEQAASAVSDADTVIHLAGVNRAPDDEIVSGNRLFAEQLASAVLSAATPPRRVVFADSIQSGNGTPYGVGKQLAADILRTAAERVGAQFDGVLLPNLFGEHGRPFYNSVVATFSHLLAEGGEPEIVDDRELTLLHAQNAADVLLDESGAARIPSLTEAETVSGLLRRLSAIASTYAGGEIPDIADPFDRDLFNTYRASAFLASPAHRSTRNADARGSFFEIVRSHGGPGQSSFSTTVSGISRGDHYHRRKVERFTVLSGEATISLRRMFTAERVDLPVSGAEPASIDMPTMWAHSITNVGESDLYTAFWTNELFDPAHPDTIAERV
ncbi:NAD-dependent epimerase/dehydratase family protein [Leifsonia sp. NPDC058292]|uniref:polysaccharide biosynthesis C-terminal domain-containing protein n=1 Tax=Leifsonia sp. NPDC058292 TaxID=3346428 RepID=UPI0036DA843E